MNLLSNAKWNAFSQLFKIGVQLINIVVLAKIIPPAEYGLMAMALVVVNLGTLLRDLGTSSAIIKEKDLSNSLINTVFWFNVFMGCILAIIVCAISPLIAELYNQDRLVEILICMSIIFPLSSCASAHLALMQRESKFKKISFVEIFSSVISLIIALVAAFNGMGVFSLIMQAISINFISALLFWRLSKWRPHYNEFVNFNEMRKILGFTANVSLFNIVNYFSRNADSFIIGKYMSAAILGGYNLAYRIMLFPLQSLTFVASRSLYPILSHHQEDTKKVSIIYLNCAFVVLLISAPLMSGLAIVSDPFVNFIFGPQWHITAEVLKWLAPTAILQSVLSTTGSVFMAKGRTDILLRLGILGTLLQVSGFIIGVQYDIEIFVKIYLLTNILNFLPAMYFVLKVLKSSLLEFFIKIAPIIISVSIMILVVIFIKKIDLVIISSDLDKLLLLSLVGFFTYFISMAIISKDFRSFLIRKNRVQ